MNNKYTTVLFDADNTLLDFDKAENEALKSVMAIYNIPVTEENCRKQSEINDALWKQFEKGEIEKSYIKATRFKKFFEFLGVKESFDPLQVNETYLSFLREGGYTMEGAAELCESLRKKGYVLYIITNGIALTQANRLKKSGLLPYIEKVFVSETIGYQKPKREYFDYVLNAITEKDKSKVIVIGDSLSSDIKGAENAGLDYIWYNHRREATPEWLNAVVVVGEVWEIGSIL